MKSNWVTSWDTSDKMYPKSAKICSQPHLHLFLRNNVYYIRYELEKLNGKRRFRKVSLKTGNYHEARQLIKDINNYMININALHQLYRELKIETRYTQNNSSVVADCVLSKDNDIGLLEQIKCLYDQCYLADIDNELEDYKLDTKIQIMSSRGNYNTNNVKKTNYFRLLDKNERSIWKSCTTKCGIIKKVLEEVGQVIGQIQQILYPQEAFLAYNQPLPQISSVQSNPIAPQSILQSPAVQASATPHHTIQEIIEQMELDQKDKVDTDTFNRKLKKIKILLSEIGVTLNDDYDKLNNQKVINKIEANILKRSLVAKTKNAWILSVNELIKSANKLEPGYYKIFHIESRNEKSMVEKKKKKKYLPFSKEDLIKTFNPEEKFFQKHPDIFYSVLISLYNSGARTNGATTLRYTDIISQDGIMCLDFKLDDDDENPKADAIKKLKTAATIRQVPIHSKLIKFGFLDYINKHRERNERKFQNFIFKRTISYSKEKKEQVYNIHFFRPFFTYLRKLGIKKDRYKSFHSFRKTINITLEKCQVPPTYINDIVGWQGKDVREDSYSQHELPDIQRELEKLQYPYLDEALEQIAKKILEKK